MVQIPASTEGYGAIFEISDPAKFSELGYNQFTLTTHGQIKGISTLSVGTGKIRRPRLSKLISRGQENVVAGTIHTHRCLSGSARRLYNAGPMQLNTSLQQIIRPLLATSLSVSTRNPTP